MAHAMADEMKKIAGGGMGNFASKIKDSTKGLGGKMREVITGERSGAAAHEAREFLKNPKSTRWLDSAGKNGPRNVDELKDTAREAIRKHHIGQAARGGAALAVGAGAGALANGGKKKESSALDELAAEAAVVKAAQAGFNLDEAAGRITAVLTLGVDESEKIAFVQDFESAVDVRALELLEVAGYPVNWA
jgi:hypothetical protein